MDAFKHHDALRIHPRLLRVIIAIMLEEVELPQVHGLAGEECIEVSCKTLGIDGFHSLVVEVAVLVARIARVAHEVVVGGEQHGLDSVHAQLRADAVGGGGLAGGGGAGEQHEANRRLVRRDLVRDAGELLRLQGLDSPHEDIEATVLDHLVQVTDRLNARDGGADALTAEHLEIRFDVGQRNNLVRFLGGRHIQHDAVVHGHELIGADNARTWRKRRLAEGAEVSTTCQWDRRRIPVAQQMNLVHPAKPLEEFDGVLVGDGLDGNRQIGLLQFRHCGTETIDHFEG